MPQQGPLLVVSNSGDSSLYGLFDSHTFPVIEANWHDASEAIARLQPAAVVLGVAPDQASLDALATRIARLGIYTPLIVVDTLFVPPHNALAFSRRADDGTRLAARLGSALRVRALHATALRRLSETAASGIKLADNDPLQDASVLLIGRGGSYPALSIALGARMAVIGALGIDAAARHLNARDLDGIVIAEGFSPRVADAFLTVLAEDPRFRHLPIVAMDSSGISPTIDLSNLEMFGGAPSDIAIHASGLIRQQALQSRLHRTLASIDAGGLLDPRTGLLTAQAFENDFNRGVHEALDRGAGLALARITLSSGHDRVRFNAARIVSRMLRRMDFATLDSRDEIVVVLTDADLKTARMIGRRLTSILKQTRLGNTPEDRIDPKISFATLAAGDTPYSLRARLHDTSERVAS